MAQDENLRLVAEVVDKFSQPLRQLRDGIQSIRSAPGVQRVHSDLTDVGRQVTNVAGAIRNTLVPALSAAGLAGFSLGAGLASVSTVFANTTARLSHLSYATGVAVQTMRELSALAPRIGINEGAIQSGLQNFSLAFDQIRKKQGDTYAELARKAPQLAEALVGSKSVDEAVSNALSFLAGVARQKGPAQARLWSQLLFGTEDLANVGQLGRDGLRKALEDIRKNLGAIDPQAVQTSRAFEKALHEMQEVAIGLRDSIGAEVLPMITDLAKGAREFLQDNREAIRGGIVGFIESVKSFDWAGFVGGIKGAATGVNDFVQSIGGWKTVVIGLVALKGISLAAPIIELSIAISRLTISLAALPLAKLAGFLGLLGAGSLAAGAGAIAAGVLGMKAIADSRSQTVIPEAQAELDRKRAQRGELAGKLSEAERLGLGDTATGRLRERLALTDREIKALEERLAKAAEAGMADGAEKAQPRIERETKSTFQKLKDWLSLSSFGGGDMGGQFGGARIFTAGLGASGGYTGRTFGGGYGGGSVPRVPLPRSGEIFPPGSTTPIAGGSFDQKSPSVMRRLIQDFGLSQVQAAAVLGNLGHESGGFRHMQELNPRGGRGGWGWAQWTGPRRRAFEAWTKERGLDPSSDEANYGFLSHELRTTERRALARLRGATNLRDATVGFENDFERSGVKAYGSRLAFARRALSAHASAGRDSDVAGGDGFDSERRRLGGQGSAMDFRYKPDSGTDLLRRAMRNGVTGSGINSIKGDASLRIDLNGFPKGTKTSTSFDGLFKDVTLHRGKAMPLASEDV